MFINANLTNKSCKKKKKKTQTDATSGRTPQVTSDHK